MSCALGEDGSAPDIAASFLKGPAPARRLEDCRLLFATERLRSTRRCSWQGRRKRWGLAAERAVEREALAVLSVSALSLRRISVGPTASHQLARDSPGQRRPFRSANAP